MRSIPAGRVVAGGRAARIVRRAAWREACPPQRKHNEYVIVGGKLQESPGRLSYHVWAVMQGLRWPLFRKNSREQVPKVAQ